MSSYSLDKSLNTANKSTADLVVNEKGAVHDKNSIDGPNPHKGGARLMDKGWEGMFHI